MCGSSCLFASLSHHISVCRNLKNGKFKPLEPKQLPYLANSGDVSNENAEFKEYPVSSDKKNWYKFFGGFIDKMLDDVQLNTGIKIVVS